MIGCGQAALCFFFSYLFEIFQFMSELYGSVQTATIASWENTHVFIYSLSSMHCCFSPFLLCSQPDSTRSPSLPSRLCSGFFFSFAVQLFPLFSLSVSLCVEHNLLLPIYILSVLWDLLISWYLKNTFPHTLTSLRLSKRGSGSRPHSDSRTR